jgi:FtsP/CotA-like multicopper oxidase with cupredoxin domain
VPAPERPLIVTHELRALETMGVVWSPDRSGNWLFHCHIAFHVIPDAQLDPPPASHNHSGDARHHMAGLILGITVHDRSVVAPPAAPTQHLRVLVQEGRPRGRAAPRAVGFVLQRGPTPPRADSVEVPGSVLILTRGTPTSITVVNRLQEPTAVHWHGIELQSYWDGVAGWSGDHRRVAPLITPQDSFTAQLTLPRAGTFMYHTHLNDVEQLTSGLYGAIVVLEPGQRWDPVTDHVVVLGWDGDADPVRLVFDGDSAPPPLQLAAGRTHRLRLINIGAGGLVTVTLRQDTTLAVWRPLAKDGADLPPALQTPGPARHAITVGETFDVAFTPPGAGVYELRGTLAGSRASRRVVVQ